jgi:adenylate kinase
VKRVLLTGMSGTGKSTVIIIERLASRTNNSYGKQPDQVARVLELMETVEPLLRRAADHEIDTRWPPGDVVATELRW